MNIPGKNGIPLWIGNYGFQVDEEPDANNIQVWIRKTDGESMGMALDQFVELMDNVWRERF